MPEISENLLIKHDGPTLNGIPMEFGTPKTLEEAIDQALCMPMNLVKERLYWAFREFAAQKFQVLYLKAGDSDELKNVEELFNSLFLRK